MQAVESIVWDVDHDLAKTLPMLASLIVECDTSDMDALEHSAPAPWGHRAPRRRKDRNRLPLEPVQRNWEREMRLAAGVESLTEVFWRFVQQGDLAGVGGDSSNRQTLSANECFPQQDISLKAFGFSKKEKKIKT